MAGADANDVPGCAYPLLAIYLLVLPEPLPIEHASTWTRTVQEREPLLDGVQIRPMEHLPPPKWSSEDQGYNFVSLRFWQVRDDQVDIPEFIHRSRLAARVADALSPRDTATADALADEHNPESYRTVVETVTFVAQPEDFEATETKPDPLSRCVKVLTSFHRSYRLAARAHVPELTYERIHPVVEWLRKAVADMTATPEVAGLLFLDNTNIPVPLSQMEPLTPDTMHAISQYDARSEAGDPFILYAERRLEAEIEAHTTGRPRESVVQTGIAAEVLLGGLLRLAMWEEWSAGQLTTEQAAAALSANLTSRIRTQYSHRFGDTWAFDRGIIQRWQTNIASTRNRVVHAGFQPTKPEALEALDALMTIERFIGDRLADRWTRYPRTAWLFLGPAGFERRNPRTLQAVDQWLTANGSNVVEWIRDYQDWREQVDAQIARTR